MSRRSGHFGAGCWTGWRQEQLLAGTGLQSVRIHSRNGPKLMRISCRWLSSISVTGIRCPALVAELVESESVPFLPVFATSHLVCVSVMVWEQTWELQRQEDAIDARVAAELTRDRRRDG